MDNKPGDMDISNEASTDRRLLVVDDERMQRLIVARSVESLGYLVDSAEGLEQAAEYLALRTYDVIVLDLSLGAREGISLLHTLRRGEADPLIVFISGMDERVRAASCRLAEALGLRIAGALEKPIVPADAARPAGQCPAAAGSEQGQLGHSAQRR